MGRFLDPSAMADYPWFWLFDLGRFGGAIFLTAPVNRSHASGTVSTAIAAFTLRRRAFGFACAFAK